MASAYSFPPDIQPLQGLAAQPPSYEKRANREAHAQLESLVAELEELGVKVAGA